MAGILIENCAVLSFGDSVSVLQDGAVAIKEDRIVYAGPREDVPAGFKPGRVIEGKDHLVLPGFVNCHTHAAMTLLRSYADDLPLMEWLEKKIWPLEAKLTPDDIYWGTLLCCLEMIKSGTTTFGDMYFAMGSVARAVEKAGMRASLSRGLIGVSPEAEKSLDESREFVGKWHKAAEGRITTMLGPHAPYTCPPEYLKRVIKMAGDLDVGIHIHIAETKQEVNDIKKQYGMSPVRLMKETGLFEVPVMAAHCVHVDDEDIAILVENKVKVAHNPESNMKLASGIAPVVKMLAAGVTVGLGTDGASSNNNLDMLEEMRSAALLQKVATMDPMALAAPRALEMATLAGAKALGLEDVGEIAPGKKADIILLNLKRPHLYPRHDLIAHVVYAAQSADVETVIIDGRVVMENRRVLTLDEEEIYSEVERRARRLVD